MINSQFLFSVIDHKNKTIQLVIFNCTGKLQRLQAGNRIAKIRCVKQANMQYNKLN